MNEKHIIIKQALENIFAGIEALKTGFKYQNRKFTIDGRLVGDIGEVIAALDYDIILYPKSKPYYDGECSDKRKVQVKATFKKSLTFGKVPDYYLGLQLFPDGQYKEIYNGPGEIIYNHYKYRSGIGEILLSFPIIELESLSKGVYSTDRIPKRKNITQ